MEIVIKASAAGIVTAVCILLIQKCNHELALTVSAAVIAVIFIASAGMLKSIFEVVEYAVGCTGLSSAVFMPIIKCAGISVIVHLSGSLCKDAGQNGIASALEFAGSAAALFTALPLVKALLETIGGLI